MITVVKNSNEDCILKIPRNIKQICNRIEGTINPKSVVLWEKLSHQTTTVNEDFDLQTTQKGISTAAEANH